MVIREAGPGDAPAIARVTVDTWKTSYRGLIDDGYLDKLTYEEREKGWREFPFDESFVFVAESQEQGIVGFAAAGRERDDHPLFRGELYAIYVRPELQNQRLGQALFEKVLQRFKERGIISFRLWALSESANRRFYERQGGILLDTRILEMGGFTSKISCFGWPEI